jgi:hypothetical protein
MFIPALPSGKDNKSPKLFSEASIRIMGALAQQTDRQQKN